MNEHDTVASDTVSEMLLSYQSVVVHDLRGDLNGLLLTVDFLRRQLASRPEIAGMFSETVGDLETVRSTLTRTLNQLEMVGHARRIVAGRYPPDRGEQNLQELIVDIAKHDLGERARRRQVNISMPEPTGISIDADAGVLHLTVQRMLVALVEVARRTDVSVRIERRPESSVAICGIVADGAQVPHDLFEKAEAAATDPRAPTLLVALGLAAQLAKLLGGEITLLDRNDEAGLCLTLPTVVPSASVSAATSAGGRA